MADSVTSSYNRNPSGKNQYPPCAAVDDPQLVEALGRYHREKLDNNRVISQRLKADYGIEMGPSTVKRRRRALGFLGSRSTMKTIDPTKAKELVFTHMDARSLKPACARTIQHRIAYEESIHLPRDFITKVIYTHLDQEQSEKSEPVSKQTHRVVKRQARPSPAANDKDRRLPSMGRSPSPRTLPPIDTILKKIATVEEVDGCEERRITESPSPERSRRT